MIAILGANGQLGSAFVRLLGKTCLSVTRAELDLSRHELIRTWFEAQRPTVVINCAAYTAVDAAETDEDAARMVNALAVGALAEAAASHDVALVTFSTDYVFDGEMDTGYVESDTPNPLNAYGRTKLEGERLALEAHPTTLVIRTSWLLSVTHPNFLTTILGRLERGEATSVVTDQTGKPTFADDLALSSLEAVERQVSGVLHLANEDKTTWFHLAREIAEIAGHNPHLVLPTTSEALGRPAVRPRNSVLDSERLSELGLTPLPSISNTLLASPSIAQLSPSTSADRMSERET